MSESGTVVFFLFHDPRDGNLPFRAVGGENIGAPWMFDLSFATCVSARDQLLRWICQVPKSEFHDLINDRRDPRDANGVRIDREE